MAKKSPLQKAKLLRLYEILTQNSDEKHPLTSDELCERLVALGISCDKRTLRRDMQTLNDQGYEVMGCMIGHKKAYYIEDRNFCVPELKILIDAVQAASFITEKKTKELIAKIAFLGGAVRSEILRSNLVRFNTHKHTNESIYYNVGTLEEAILEKKKASFFYFDLNENGERVYRKDKWRYTVYPLALIFVDDNYYLMTYHSKKGSIVNYRVDRMEQVKKEEDLMSDEALAKMSEITEYTEQAFLMYSGDKETVTLEFDDCLIGVICDRFGEETKMIRTGEHTIVATVSVQISPTFWGWLFQFAGKMKILSPASVADKYREQAAKIIE